MTGLSLMSSQEQPRDQVRGVATTQAAQSNTALESSSPQDKRTLIGDLQTQGSHAFSGRVESENGQFILKDRVTKLSYQFDDQSKVKQYFGKQIKVTGKLDLNSNTIHIESIEPLS